jgi:hypothetical protein
MVERIWREEGHWLPVYWNDYELASDIKNEYKHEMSAIDAHM